MATPTPSANISPAAFSRIQRRMTQYRSTRGRDMPQYMMDSLLQAELEAEMARSDERRAMNIQESQFGEQLAENQRQFNEQLSYQEDLAKLQGRQQAMSGLLNTGMNIAMTDIGDFENTYLGQLIGGGGQDTVAGGGGADILQNIPAPTTTAQPVGTAQGMSAAATGAQQGASVLGSQGAQTAFGTGTRMGLPSSFDAVMAGTDIAAKASLAGGIKGGIAATGMKMGAESLLSVGGTSMLGAGVGSLLGGMVGGETGSTIGGAAGGAITGFMVGGPVGGAIGGVVGAITGIVGGGK